MAEEPNKMVYLHGDLDLHIYQARHLPNMDLTSERLRLCFTSCSCSSPKTSDDLPSSDTPRHHHRPKIITSDPYVSLVVPQATLARTRVIPNSQNPCWNEHFTIPMAHPVTTLDFQVKDDDVFGAQIIGTFSLPATRVLSGDHISGWFPILSPSSGKPPKPDTAIRIEVKFTPVQEQINVTQTGVKRTYFPVRKGSKVKLYQDAHVRDCDVGPEIKLENGEVYKRGQCWEDICYAISEAHHMIYIVGWSVFHKVKLVREPTRPLPRGGDLTLGELLKYKSEEGVRVLLLVWDDKTSHSKYFINTEGVMATHDEETRKFFKHSSVMCVLSPRYGSSKLSYFKQQQKWLPLHTLAACGEFYLMNILLKNDLDINAADQDGLTALHKAITSKKQAIINYLLRESTDPSVLDKDGATLMHYAVRTASSQSIKTLLLHNVDINLQDEDGWTPLHLAVQTRRTDVVRLLLMKGADKTLKNKDGLTPLELCLYSGRDTKTYELIKLLKELPRQES